MPRRRQSKQMKKKMTSKLDYMPSELMEQILLKLPVKSLFRFSTASKLWNSIIFRPEFAQSYRGHDMIVFNSLRALPFSSMYNPIDETTPFEFPPGSFLASCGHLWLWCLKFENSLLLYNPSIQTYRKLPNPVSADDVDDSVYGLGYDSVCDDYKILKIRKRCRYHRYDEETTEAEMYSLRRSDCWRKLESQIPEFTYFVSEKGLFVSGAFHWLITRTLQIGGERIEKKNILSFDHSEEKFGLMELPELLPLPQPYFMSQHFDMIVFGGKLRVYLSCLSSRNYDDCHFSVWVMEDYESKLWTKEMEIDYGHMPRLRFTFLKPFYFYDHAGNLVRAVTSFFEREKMFIYKEEDGSSTPTLVEKNFGIKGFDLMGSLTYVESIVSPLTLLGSSS